MAVDVPADNKKGFRIRYVYYGPWYMWDESESVIRREKVVYTGTCLLEAVCFLTAATRECALNYHVLVGMFGMLAVAAFVFKAIGVVRFGAARKRMTRPAYQEISGMMKVAGSLEAAMLFAASAAGFAVMFIERLPVSVLPVAAGYLAAASLAVSVCVRFRKLRCVTEPNDVMR